MRLLRAGLFNGFMWSSGLVLSLWCLLASRREPARVLAVAKLWARLCLRALWLLCGIGFEIKGQENLPEGGAIIAAQHQSTMDIFTWLAVLPLPAFVFKRELAKIPLFGPMLVPGGMIPVDRGGGAAALQEMIAGCAAALAAGRQVVIFLPAGNARGTRRARAAAPRHRGPGTGVRRAGAARRDRFRPALGATRLWQMRRCCTSGNISRSGTRVGA